MSKLRVFRHICPSTAHRHRYFGRTSHFWPKNGLFRPFFGCSRYIFETVYMLWPSYEVLGIYVQAQLIDIDILAGQAIFVPKMAYLGLFRPFFGCSRYIFETVYRLWPSYEYLGIYVWVQLIDINILRITMSNTTCQKLLRKRACWRGFGDAAVWPQIVLKWPIESP